MVLKRLFVTALGAFGLGALATGPAFAADDQIPGPRLYGDISSCAGGMLPTASTAMGSMSLLGMGGVLDQAFDSDASAMGIQMDYTQDAARIVTATTDNESNALVALLSVADCNNPVANNVSQAVTLYDDYVSAKKLFEDLEEPDADDTAAFNTARMNKDDFGGDVYNTVYDQQAKLAAANKAISDYNKLVGSTGTLAQLKDNVDSGGTAQAGGYDDINIAVSTTRVTDWNPAPTDADNSALTGDALNDNINAQVAPVYGSGNTAGYRAIAGRDVSGDPAVVITASSGTEFNDAGALQFEEPNDANAFARAATNVTTLGQINAELAVWQTAVNSAATGLKAAQDAGNVDTRAQQETLRRATLGRDHVQGELDRLTRVVRSQNLNIESANRVTIEGSDTTTTDDDVTYEKERDLLDAYLGSRSNVMSAASKVRTAVSNLDSANRAVQSRLKDPNNYLGQLVTLREYQEMQAMNALKEAGGDDALQSFKDAVEDAGKAVTAARAQLMAHQNLTSDPDSTTSRLLNALLEPDEIDGETNPADDDGLALVNAISEVDGKIADVAQNIQDVEDLAGPVAANTAKNAEQDMKLMQKKEYIENLAEEIGIDPVTGEGTGENGMSRIDTNAANIATNASNIMTNAGNIATNATAIGMNTGAIADNTAAIGMNTGAIADLNNRVGSNASAISRNEGMIGELNDALEVVRAGVAASMALAGMPAINGRGVSIGVGSYDGESAFAVGFQIQGEMASFKVGITSAGGETGASAGVGFQF